MHYRSPSMTRAAGQMFQWLVLCGLAAFLAGLGACKPLPRETPSAAAGTYIVSSTKLYLSDEPFDLKDEAVYPQPKVEGLVNPTTTVTDRDLTMYRCTWCHECGFKQAWDWNHYGSTEWKPRYRGEQWQSVVERMMKMENSFLHEEQIVRRIYQYLYKDSLGTYSEEADTKGATQVEVDQLPAEGAGDRNIESGASEGPSVNQADKPQTGSASQSTPS